MFSDDAVPEIIPLQGGEIHLYPHFISPSESEDIVNALLNEVAWQQDSLNIAGRQVAVPRLQAWYADDGLSYTYSGLRLEANAWIEPLQTIKARLEPVAGERFNSALLNLYRHGQDSVDWHADDEPELGANPVIASLSLGCCRTFEIKRKDQPLRTRQKIQLDDGCLLVMTGAMQHHWVHRVPKEPGITGSRINLTFRTVINRG